MFKEKWYIDNGCPRQITEKANLFSLLKLKKGGKVTFGDKCQRRLSHALMKLIGDLSKGDHAIILPKVNFQKDKVCRACQISILKELNQQRAMENDQVISLLIEQS